MTTRQRRILAWTLVLLPLAGLALAITANLWITRSTRKHIVTSPQDLPLHDVALVLGTSPFVGRHHPNPFFEGRMNAAARLYESGKVRHLLVSGDNDKATYDEPTAMRDALIRRGVPAAAITLDYAGFRTLDSMIRAKAVFGLTRFIIVTDDFHQPRSIFLAKSQGLDVIGYPSDHVPDRWSKRTRTRELLSRTVAFLDVYVLHTKPRFYGPPVKIELAQAQ